MIEEGALLWYSVSDHPSVKRDGCGRHRRMIQTQQYGREAGFLRNGDRNMAEEISRQESRHRKRRKRPLPLRILRFFLHLILICLLLGMVALAAVYVRTRPLQEEAQKQAAVLGSREQAGTLALRRSLDHFPALGPGR